ncbi:hypothetical protein AB1Y20_012107 [Prymnesium parvum]|uniref:Tr-type G domain-containing protein n=1 Tax=Prymnesium parvum TaxID=97485 RepID=A0AB34INI9_PRYPA
MADPAAEPSPEPTHDETREPADPDAALVRDMASLQAIEPERDDGNIEYKLKLTDEREARVQRLATQMRYRCDEGGSECLYRLGVEDDGTLTGLSDDEYAATIRCLQSAATMNAYTIHTLAQTRLPNGRSVYEVCIREHNEDSYIDVKVAIAGSVDCGKSTLLSVLTNGQPDNGRGAARLAVFNYPHEVESGRTSSIGHQILGYDAEGSVMNYQQKRVYAWPEVVKRSAKIISFFDLAGHEKYLKTTIFGLSSSRPDACLIMVGGNRGVLKMTVEHMFLCKTLNVPFGIVVTKTDMMKDKLNVLEDTLASIMTLLKKPLMRRIPIKIKNPTDIIRCAQNIHSEAIVPIFMVSNVTMEGIAELHTFLNLLPKRVLPPQTDEVEMHLDAAWTVPGVGTVLGGHLMSGAISVGDKLWFGPNQNKYVQITVRSIHCKRVPVQRVAGNSYVCLGVKGIYKQNVHKGNVLVSAKTQQVLCTGLVVDVQVLKTHSTTIRVGYQPILHSQNVRTSVSIEDICHKVSARPSAAEDGEKLLRTGDTAELLLRLRFDKQFLKPGNHVLLCEGRTKVVGFVKEIFED